MISLATEFVPMFASVMIPTLLFVCLMIAYVGYAITSWIAAVAGLTGTVKTVLVWLVAVIVFIVAVVFLILSRC